MLPAVLAAVLLGGGLTFAVTGTREPAAALKLLSGDSWLSNRATGTFSHVGGYSGRVDAQVAVGRPGDPFEVVQRPDGAYVLDQRTGRLSRISGSTMTVAASRPTAGKATAIQVVAAGDATWLLDSSSGVVSRVDPQSFAPIGKQVALGGPTGTAVGDDAGDLWVPQGNKGLVAEITGDDLVHTNAFGHPGDPLAVAPTSTGIWAVDTAAGQARPVSDPAAPPVAVPATDGAPLVAGSPASSHLLVLPATQTTLLDIDTSHSSLSTLNVPGGGRVAQLAVSGGKGYLLDVVANQLDSVNLDPLATLPPVSVPAGSDQLVAKDNLVFVNNPDSAAALVVDPAGQVTDVTKYVAAGPSSGHPSPPDASSPASSTSPATVPTGANPALSLTSPITAPVQSNVAAAGGAAATTLGPPPTAPPPTAAPPQPTLPPKPTTTTTAPPGVPASVTATAGDSTIAGAWSPPANDGGSPITSYKVSVVPNGGGNALASTTVPAGGRLTASFSGRQNDTTVCVQVQAVNKVGAGNLSSPTGPACATPRADSPGQVAAPSVAKQTTVGALTVTWKAPGLGPYNTPIKSYTLKVSPASVGPLTTAATSATVSGLSPGVAYSFSVTATNATGNAGPAGAASAPVTTWSKPGPPRNLAVDGELGKVAVSWSAPSTTGGAAITGYTVSWGGGRATVASTTYTITGTGSYSVSVVANNAVGSSGAVSGQATSYAQTQQTVHCKDSLTGATALERGTICSAGNTGAWQFSAGIHPNLIPPSGPIPNGFVVLCGAYNSKNTYQGTQTGGFLYDLQSSVAGCANLQSEPGVSPGAIAYVSPKPVAGLSGYTITSITTSGTMGGPYRDQDIVAGGSSFYG